MKILFILRGFVNGGVERRAVNLANEFAARGHIVEVAAFQGKCFPPVFETAENVSFYFSGDTVKPQPAYKAPAAKGDKNTKLQIAKELNEIAKIIIELHHNEKQGKTP